MHIENAKPPRGKAGRNRQQAAPAVAAAEEDADGVAAQIRALGPEAEEFARRLLVANMFGMSADCAHEPCRRAGTCRGEDVACLDERRPELTRRVLRHVVMLLLTANVSSDAFYDYLDAIGEAEEDGEDTL